MNRPAIDPLLSFGSVFHAGHDRRHGDRLLPIDSQNQRQSRDRRRSTGSPRALRTPSAACGRQKRALSGSRAPPQRHRDQRGVPPVGRLHFTPRAIERQLTFGCPFSVADRLVIRQGRNVHCSRLESHVCFVETGHPGCGVGGHDESYWDRRRCDRNRRIAS